MADSRREYYKDKIRDKLNEIRNDIGEARYLLYCDIVDDCDDISMLKQMAEIDMQIGYIKYVREQISNKINELGFTVSDIEEIMSGFGEKDVEIEVNELSSNSELMRLDEDDEERDLALLQEMAKRYLENRDCDGERIDGCRIGQEVNVLLEEQQYNEQLEALLEEACEEVTEYEDEEYFSEDGEEEIIEEEIIEEDDSNLYESDCQEEEIDNSEDGYDEQVNIVDELGEIDYEAIAESEETVEGDIDGDFEIEEEIVEEAYEEDEADSEDYDVDEELIEEVGDSEEIDYSGVEEEEIVEEGIDNEEIDYSGVEEDELVEEGGTDFEVDFSDENETDYSFDVEEDFVEEANTLDFNIEEETVDEYRSSKQSTTANKSLSGNGSGSNGGVKNDKTGLFTDKNANKIFNLMSKLLK